MDAHMTGGQQARFLSKLSEWIAEEATCHLEYKAKQNAQCFESPIELAFWLAWLTRGYAEKIFGEDIGLHLEPRAQFSTCAGGRNYRLDFAFVDESKGVKVAVELDGHDFHERTPEQVEYRNQRDADLQASEWAVLHFSGRQVLRDPMGCVELVCTTIRDNFERAAYASWLAAGKGRE